MKERVEEVLSKIRPALVADGGDVQLVDVKEGVVRVKLTGASMTDRPSVPLRVASTCLVPAVPPRCIGGLCWTIWH